MNKEDLKLTISRSYSRKINLGNYNIPNSNYETTDFWASYSEELPSNASKTLQNARSVELYQKAVLDVENAIKGFLNGKLNKVIDKEEKIDKKQKQEESFTSELQADSDAQEALVG